MNSSDIKYLTEALSTDLAEMLAKDFNVGIAAALDLLFNSDTYSKLINPHSGLYFQSAEYVYSFLRNELNTGRIA